MPDCKRHSLQHALEEIKEASALGIKSFILFPKIADNLKSNMAEEAYNADGLVPRAVKTIKEKFPDVVVCTDVALDPYSDQVVRYFAAAAAAATFVAVDIRCLTSTFVVVAYVRWRGRGMMALSRTARSSTT